jgi:hypothetical protein
LLLSSAGKRGSAADPGSSVNPRFIDLPTWQQKKNQCGCNYPAGSSMKQLWKLAINYLLDAIDFFFVVCPPSSGWSVGQKFKFAAHSAIDSVNIDARILTGFRQHLLVTKVD